MKAPLKLICLIAVALMLGGVWVWWKVNRPGTETTQRRQNNAGATSSPRPDVQGNPRTPEQPGVTAAPQSPGAQASPPVGISSSIPERLRLAFDAAISFRERVDAVRAIRGPLTDAERDAFYRYLRVPANEPQNQVNEDWLRNELLDKFVQQEDLPAGLPDLLVAIYQDHDQDAVMRDYAVQHMAPAYERAAPEDRAKLQAAIWDATGETDTSIAGTALLALLDLSQSGSSLDRCPSSSNWCSKPRASRCALPPSPPWAIWEHPRRPAF